MQERNKACKEKHVKAMIACLDAPLQALPLLSGLVCWSKQLLTADYKMIIQFINANMTIRTILLKTE